MQQKRRKMFLLMVCFCTLAWIGGSIENFTYKPPKVKDPLKFLKGKTNLKNIAKIKDQHDYNYKW